ncbi:DUF418 domain-containing protein [Bacillus sp. C1]
MVTPSKRIEGLDFARALAMFGMLIVNYKILTGAAGNGPGWLIWFAELFEGRASATFVMLAGIGVALMTKKARSGTPFDIKQNRMNLWKRSIFLFILGLLLYAVGWTGDILHYYGVYMLVASLFIIASDRCIFIGVAIFLFVAQILQITINYMKGWHLEKPFIEYIDFWTVEGFVRNLLFNGYHPVFPWICFLLIGMVIGKLDLTKEVIRRKLMVISVILLVVIEVCSQILLRVSLSLLDKESLHFLFQTGPIPPTIFYIVSNSASAIIVILLSIYITEKLSGHWFTNAIVKTGQLTLTHYVSHVFIGIGILIPLNRVENQTLTFALTFSLLFFIGSIIFSVIWRRKYKRGPIEFIMRKITG